MKKNLAILLLALFAFACSGSPDQTKETTAVETETVIVDENMQSLESTTMEIIDEAEKLASEVDSLMQNL